MIELTIDEKKISVEANTTILDAARSVGIHIPTLCAYRGLSPIGACRVCVVEVEGERKPVASCHVPVQKGMAVRTDTPKLWEIRKMMLELILATHPLDCPICDKGGECELQDITHAFEIKENKYKLNNPLRTKVGANPFLYIDFQKCIQCVRCARYTEDVEGVKAFDYHGSGGYSSEMDRRLEKDFEAESIAGVIAVCPVGSLLERPFKLHSRRPWDLTKTQTTCPHCSDGCQLVLNTSSDKIYRVTAVSETDFSQGHPCLRGRFGYGFINHPSRLKAPLNKIAGVQKEASWDDALERAASNIKDIKEKYGTEAIWGIASPRLTNEEHLAFASLFSSLGEGNVILSSGVGNTAASGVREVMGEGYSIPLSYIENSDLIIVIGSDLTETNPFLANRISRTARLKESRSVVINPRKIELCKSSWRWLAPKPGT
ncbi:MAG: molybdopterin-dependent oxidoreductase [Deltaproteobacteria bacterium]|nr:molybdopterin-dependent oxidoreductase [Deltaproteobacteria bacterium]